MPALLFNALAQRSVAEILNLNYLLAYALGSLVMVGLDLWWARRVLGQSLSYSSMVAMGMFCPNSGFVGYPIILLSLGPVAGVALALNMVVENFLLLPLLLFGAWWRVLRFRCRVCKCPHLSGAPSICLRSPVQFWGCL